VRNQYCETSLFYAATTVDKLREMQSDVAKDSGLQGRDAVSFGEWLPTFRRNVVPLSSGSSRTRR
jgi:hypothetical protein